LHKASSDNQLNEVLTQVGDKVRFSVDDIFLPDAGSVFVAAPGEVQVEGTVVNFSDSGSAPRMFAVVEVIRRQTVVVPIEKLQLNPRGSSGS
jgi:hypothetical protein